MRKIKKYRDIIKYKSNNTLSCLNKLNSVGIMYAEVGVRTQDISLYLFHRMFTNGLKLYDIHK